MLKDCIRSLVALTMVAACSITAVAQGAQKSGRQARDEAAIRETIRNIEAGWNAKNGTLFAESYTEDADAVAVGGFIRKGHDDIEKAHWDMFRGSFKNSTIALKVKQLRFLRADVALVQVDNTNKLTRGETTHEFSSVITMVMTKEAGRWKVASFQNTIAEPPSFSRQK